MKKPSWRFVVLGLLCGCLSVHPGTPAASRSGPEDSGWLARLPSGERWLQHVRSQLLPFWTQPSALGSPLGAFPSVRCDDGSALDRSHPCPELQDDWLLQDRTYVVTVSRQVYAYGVAFHLTGDTRYLEYARAGVDYLRQHAQDREHGGTWAWRDGRTGTWGPAPEERSLQELAYALLGTGFYYYLTRDEAVLDDIRALKASIFQRHGDPRMQALQRAPLRDGVPDTGPRRLVDTLDQLNAYLLLLTPLLPEQERRAWTEDEVSLAHRLMEAFHSPEEGLFFLEVSRPEDKRLGHAPNDLGHTIKSLWMIRMVGQASGEEGLVRFAEEQGRRVLERAFRADSGTWGRAVQADGRLDTTQEWWIHAELDQFAASLALVDGSVGACLPATYDHWFRFFVDSAHGEVWTQLDGATNQPLHDLPKQWPWKNGYHTFEHALVGYITSRQLHGEPVVLHYAFDPARAPGRVRPYFYSGALQRAEEVAPSVWRVSFTDVR